MKISLDLFDSTMPHFNIQLREAYEGVIEGWGHLPPKIQNLVLWTGVKFDSISGIQVQVQLEWEIVTGDILIGKLNSKHTFSLSKSENIKARTKERFKKTVLESLERIAKGLQNNAEDLRDRLK